MPEPMISPASQFFIPAMRGGRIAIAAAQTVTKKVTTGLAARKATKVAAKKATEAKVRSQQRARAEQAERRKLLEQNKEKAGTSKKPVAEDKKRKRTKVAQKSVIVGSAANNERRKMKADAK